MIYKVQFLSLRYSLSLTLSTSYPLLFIRRKLSAKAITTPTNKDLHLCSTPINIRFHRTHNASTYTLSLRVLALIHIYLFYSLNSYTYLSVRVLCFANPPSCPPNKGTSQGSTCEV